MLQCMVLPSSGGMVKALQKGVLEGEKRKRKGKKK